MGERDLDRHVYRIMKREHVVEAFDRKQIAFAPPSSWPDGFENFQLKLGSDLAGAPLDPALREGVVGQCWTRSYLADWMWAAYARPGSSHLRIRSTPRRLLRALVAAHPGLEQRCFVGRVRYRGEGALKAIVEAGVDGSAPAAFAEALMLKRRAFAHEREVRLLYFGEAEARSSDGLYRWNADPRDLITQIMAPPTGDGRGWETEKARIRRETTFAGEIRRSKLYDPPSW